MIGYKVDQAKGAFFDRKAVMDRVPPAERKALSKAGALVRKIAQKSIQIREGSSAPGEPPHGHVSGTRTRKSKSTGRVRTQGVSLLREFIYFVYLPSEHNVIIGPALLNGTVTTKALKALEHGGDSEGQFVEHGQVVRKRISVKARPFMTPALAEALPQVAPAWTDLIR